MDGIGIGLAYRVDLATGSLVSMAVVAHDIADGLNIVTLGLLTGTDRSARIWLALDCTAPIVGVLLGLTVMPAGSAFGPILAVMAGGLLYVGASEMLPRLGTADARRRSAIAALSGMAFIYLVTG